jgi:SAM-dependent methyltransferase
MLDIFAYDFGYSWSLRYAMLAPLILAGMLAALAAWRSWSRWVVVPLALVAIWAAAAVVILNAMLNRPMSLPTERFLTSGSGQVLDVGAGSGRAAIGVALARPGTTVIGVDIYSGYWGIDENTPERFMRNARTAGVAERAAARVGDMRLLPFDNGQFDAVVSSYAIDHLPRADRPKAIAEVARVLKPGGEFLLMLVQVDWRTWLVSPPLAHHPSQDPRPWRAWLHENGFAVEQEGTPFATLYFLARKQDVRRGSRRGRALHPA